MNRSSSQFLKLFEIILQRKSMYIFMASVCYAFTMDMLLFSGESILYSLDSLGISMYFGHEFYSVTEYDDKLFWKSKVFLWVEKKKKNTFTWKYSRYDGMKIVFDYWWSWNVCLKFIEYSTRLSIRLSVYVPDINGPILVYVNSQNQIKISPNHFEHAAQHPT